MSLLIEEVENIVANFAELKRGWDSQVPRTRGGRVYKNALGYEYPEFWDGYNFSAKIYDSIIPHSRADVYPERLLSVRAPNQSDEQAEYIKQNYKAVTLPVYEDFKATISRCFADQSWSLTIKPEVDMRFAEETYANYISHGIEKFGSIENFVKSMLPSLKLTDPNGIIAVEPDDLRYGGRIEQEGTERVVVLGNELIKPVPVYYNCKSIVGQEFGEYYLVITHEKSMVKVGSKMEQTGMVLKLYDQTAIYTIYQTGKKTDMQFSAPELYFQHNLGYVPCIKLMGQPQLINSGLAFQSPFSTAVPILDQVVLDESYLQMSKATSAFPFMYALGEICDFTDAEGNICNGGEIFDSLNGGRTSCPSCKGSGLISRFSPTGTLLIKPKSLTSDGDTGLSGEYIKFVSPPMDTLTFLRSEINTGIMRSRENLHLPSADEVAKFGESSSATGSQNKRRALDAFVKPISDQMYTIWEFILVTTGEMRYGEFFGGVNMSSPNSFDNSTPSDYLSIISEGVKAGVPPSITFENISNYIRAVNYNNPERRAINDLIIAADDILLMSSADIVNRISNGTIEKWQDVLHQSAPQLIMQLMREHIPTELNPTYLSLPLSEQITLLNELSSTRVNVTLDPIAEAQKALINGII